MMNINIEKNIRKKFKQKLDHINKNMESMRSKSIAQSSASLHRSKKELHDQLVVLDKHLDQLMASAVQTRNDHYLIEQKIDLIRAKLLEHLSTSTYK